MAGLWKRILSTLLRKEPPKPKAGCPHCAEPSRKEAGLRALEYPKEKAIRRVFINEGCMICCACESECPEVFKLPAAQSESLQSAGFTPDASTYFESRREKIEAAAHGCCVSVIGIEYTDGTFSPLGNHPGKVEHVVPDSPELPILKAERG